MNENNEQVYHFDTKETITKTTYYNAAAMIDGYYTNIVIPI